MIRQAYVAPRLLRTEVELGDGAEVMGQPVLEQPQVEAPARWRHHGRAVLLAADDLASGVPLRGPRGLDLPDSEIRANVIDTLLAVADPSAKSNNSTISEHASSLVATMLKNSMVRDMPSAVRLDRCARKEGC